MYQIFLSIVLCLGSIGSSYFLRKYYLQDKEKLEKKYSTENFERVNMRVLSKEVGVVSYYKTARFVPYVRYSYSFQNKEYTNDYYSFPTEYEHVSDVTVKRILNLIPIEWIAYVRKDNPSESYILLYRDEMKKEIDNSFWNYLSTISIPIVLLFSAITVLPKNDYFLQGK